MHHLEIWRDINDAVRRALVEGLDQLDERELATRSDALLANLPVVSGQQPSTALLLRRYTARLHGELCAGNRPRANFDSLEDELRELTRAVIVTINAEEGMSIESAVLLGLLLRTRGVAQLCAQPSAVSLVTS